jgi:hypothetical protein
MKCNAHAMMPTSHHLVAHKYSAKLSFIARYLLHTHGFMFFLSFSQGKWKLHHFFSSGAHVFRVIVNVIHKHEPSG